MSGRFQRDYADEDFFRIHNPSIYHIRRLKKAGVVICECCRTISDTDEIEHSAMFKYHHDTVLTQTHRIKLIYCSDCLKHFGCLSCPVIRGVPAYKTIDPVVLAKLRAM